MQSHYFSNLSLSVLLKFILKRINRMSVFTSKGGANGSFSGSFPMFFLNSEPKRIRFD